VASFSSNFLFPDMPMSNGNRIDIEHPVAVAAPEHRDEMQ
jgi:hypothetical protein